MANLAKSIPVALTCFFLCACAPPVKVEQETDGTETISMNTKGGSMTFGKEGNNVDIKSEDGSEAHAKSNADGTTAMTGKDKDGNEFSMQSGKEVDLGKFGLQNYGNKEKSNGASSSVEADTAEGKSANLTFATKDSIDQVIGFYEKQIAKDKSTYSANGSKFVSGKTSNGAEVFISASASDGLTQVSISASLKKS
ncbi:MAG: hypothetical protein JSS71_10025 [Armatimonadetes bacterium]|nr:hypothetical protein [Armatimonadota bacterium]MBX3109397.1 hypothetical protein [Fimbriimonadaceae bacterium]